MDLYQLRYFLEVARELNFTRAAENLHLSPPAVSRSVALLEKSLGKPLLTRNKRHVALTTHGELLKVRVERIYDELERTEQELHGRREAGPSFLRIGSREMITDYLMPRPLLDFRQRYPHTRFGIHELDPGEMAECLKKDQIDAGFYYFAIPDPALEVRRLGLLDSHIYASPRLLPKGRATPFEKTLELPWIAPRYFRADPAAPSLDGFPDTAHKRNIQYEGEFLETHRRYVLDGVAVAVLPDLVVAREHKAGEVVKLRGPRLYREIFFMKRRARTLPSAVDQLCESIRSVLTRLGRA